MTCTCGSGAHPPAARTRRSRRTASRAGRRDLWQTQKSRADVPGHSPDSSADRGNKPTLRQRGDAMFPSGRSPWRAEEEAYADRDAHCQWRTQKSHVERWRATLPPPWRRSSLRRRNAQRGSRPEPTPTERLAPGTTTAR